MLQELKLGAWKTTEGDTMPVVFCISSVTLEGKESHDDLPPKYVALLMTMTHNEDYDAIVKSIKNLATNPQEIVVH